MADAMEALGQHVQQEAPDELVRMMSAISRAGRTMTGGARAPAAS